MTDLVAGLQGPEDRSRVLADQRQFTVRREREAADAPVMAGEYPQLRTRRDVPKAGGLVRTAGEESSAVGGNLANADETAGVPRLKVHLGALVYRRRSGDEKTG